MPEYITTNEEAAARPLPERLLDAAAAIRDDIRGYFKGSDGEYQRYLVRLLNEAAAATRQTDPGQPLVDR
jgi:hypothetical protein